MIYKKPNIFYKSSAIFYKKVEIFYNRFYKKQKRFYKTFDSFYKTSNIVYNVWNFATQPIMHIKMPLQFNFSLRFQRKVRSTENRVIGQNKKQESETNSRITAIYGLCGYSDFSTFNKNFNKFKGMSPLEYKKLYYKN